MDSKERLDSILCILRNDRAPMGQSFDGLRRSAEERDPGAADRRDRVMVDIAASDGATALMVGTL